MNDSIEKEPCDHLIGFLISRENIRPRVISVSDLDAWAAESFLPKFIIKYFRVDKFKTCPVCGEKL